MRWGEGSSVVVPCPGHGFIDEHAELIHLKRLADEAIKVEGFQVLGVTKPDNAMIGMFGSLLRTDLSNAGPSMCGIRMSVMIRYGGADSTAFSASMPSPASSTR